MRLAKMLQQAHAIEIGAYQAYRGHCRSLPSGSDERRRIRIIQLDELNHRKTVAAFLKELGSKPSPVLDWTFWIIGRTISVGCHVIGRRMAMWGAKIMEKLGGICYHRIAEEANKEGLDRMSSELRFMQYMEEKHEEFFRSQL